MSAINTSSGILSLVTGLFTPVTALAERINSYKEKRETKARLTDALEAEIDQYNKVLERFGSTCDEKYLPAILQIDEKSGATPFQILRIVDTFSDFPQFVVDFIRSFIGLAKACKNYQTEFDQDFLEKTRKKANCQEMDQKSKSTCWD